MLNNLKKLFRKKQAERYRRKLYFPFDKKWFEGKRVAVIGGANSVLKEKLGAYIDGFDVVVRINKGVEVIAHQHEFVGNRTDVLFHSFMDNPKVAGSSPITGELWKEYKVDKIIYSANFESVKRGIYDVILFAQKSKEKLRFSDIPQAIHKKNLAAIAPYHPTTGYIAINTIFQCQPEEIYITGITFFKTPHNKEYRKQDISVFKDNFVGKPGDHNPDAEYEVVKKLWQTSSIITPDSILKEIFETN